MREREIFSSGKATIHKEYFVYFKDWERSLAEKDPLAAPRRFNQSFL
jgi:hypothetical protein